MKRLFRFLIPPKQWRIPVIILLGAISGLSLYAMVESKAISYLSDDPKTCANCHVMTPQYTTWKNSSHREWAKCNDCHVPHDNVFNKYYFKAKDGLYHATIFTARAEPDVIKMQEASQKVVQDNCIRCHVQQVTQTKYAGFLEDHKENRTKRQCWSCHKQVPHGKIHGLLTIKFNVAPLPTDQEEMVIPAWLADKIKE